jgi:hypothetical protein
MGMRALPGTAAENVWWSESTRRGKGETMNFHGFAVIKKQLAKTQNLFGPEEEISGKTLSVLERNESGDCLCLFTGAGGHNLVDVSACDVERFLAMRSESLPFSPTFIQALVELAAKTERKQ